MLIFLLRFSETSSGAIVLEPSDFFWFRRRSINIAKISAAIPSTPSDTPSPIPAFMPVGIPLLLFDEILIPLEIADGDSDVTFVELVEGSGVDVEAARATLNPTTAMAPTLDEVDIVVVTILQSVVAVEGVEAYVKIIPFEMPEMQLPLTGPLVASRLE